MFQSLIESPEASEEILAKIAGDLIAKYQIKQLNNPHEFVNDVNMALHQMKLYNSTLQQLQTKNNPSQYKLLVNSHQYSFKIIDFLAKIIRKVCHKPNSEGLANHHYKQHSLCDSCSSHIQHKNIKQLQSQILDQRLYQYQQISTQITQEADEKQLDDDRFATPQQLLMKKMVKIQKNINERQVNLLRCIDDFQNIRIDLLIGIKKRQFDRDFSSFDLKAYSIELTKHFVSNLNRIEDKIGALKRNTNVVQDQGVQANIPLNEEGVTLCLKAEPLLKSQHSRAEADIRKLNEMKARLEDNCKRYQVQVKELNNKLDSVENQNKVLREQLTNEKFKTLVKEKTVKIVQKSEERQKKENPQGLKRQSMLMMLSNDGVLAGQFANSFIENYIVSSGRRDEQITPIIKATFKRTFDNFFNQRMSLNLTNLERKPLIKHDSLDEQVMDKRRKSKKKSMRFQIEPQARQSRFAQKRQVSNSSMTISTQLNYKIVFEKPTFATRSSIQKNASESNYRKSMLYTEGSIKRRKNRESKLDSILTQYKQNQKSESIFRHQKKYSETFEPQSSDIGIQVRKMQRKMKKSKLNHNPSKFSREKDNVQELGCIPAIKIKSINVTNINSHVIKQFLFIEDQQSELAKQTNLQNKHKRHKFNIDALTLQTPNRNEKAILNLEQINYLTQFYSLLAKMHIVNAGMYLKLKEWIFSKVNEEKMKGYESKHSLILKKITSQIVFKHRECHRSPNLCPHLILFLREVQKCLSSQQGPQQE